MIALVLLFGLSACGPSVSESSAHADSAPPIAVSLVAPVEVSVPVDVVVTGQLVGSHRARVAAGTTGRLTSVEAERGAALRRGDTIARVDDRLLRAALDQARAQLAQAEANQRIAADSATRARALFDGALSNQAALDQALTAAATADATVAAARAAVRSAEVRAEDARIKAPFDGVVVVRNVSPGEYVRDDSPVIELVGTADLRLELTLAERDAAAIAGGEEVLFTVQGDPTPRHARVDRVAPAFRESSRDLVVEALVDPADAANLRPGAFVSARLRTGARPALAVPAAAVRTSGAVSRVFVEVEGRVEERIVPTGPEMDGQTTILDGLSAGERVVNELSAAVVDGARIAG
jgi:membrane fusion protein (multidrug efflux system)